MVFTRWTFPWPVLIVPVMIGVFMAVFMAVRLSGRGSGMGPGCGIGPHRHHTAAPNPGPGPVAEDPMVTLRDRYVRGEINTDEFEHRLNGLLHSDPGEKIPWWNSEIPTAIQPGSIQPRGPHGSDTRHR